MKQPQTADEETHRLVTPASIAALDGAGHHETSVRPDTSDTAQPDDFLCGVAISVYQNSGGVNTNWEAFENEKCFFSNNIQNGDKCGVSNDFWNCFEADIERAADLNCRLFRLSIEWSRITPLPGEVDMAAVQRYHEMFDVMDRLGMQSTVTLYHFVHPLWFEQLGHFEREENIQHYVDFVKVAFKHFGGRTSLWVTFNEPGVQAFCSYVHGSFPPAKKGQFDAAGRFLLHLYQAHIAAYKAIKASKGGDCVQVGIVHNYMNFEVKDPSSFTASWVRPIVEVINKCWGNDILVELFTSGTFTWPKFLSDGFSWQYPDGRAPCDFVGLNYYGRGVINWMMQPTSRKGDIKTDMPFAAYAPGLYEGIACMSQIGLPIYITETGICDHTTLKRPAFFHAFLDQIVKAVEDGYDVRGITMWTLVDNFEWALGWSKKFGLYGWDHDEPTNKRTLHETSKVLGDLYKQLPRRIREARQHHRQHLLTGNGVAA